MMNPIYNKSTPAEVKNFCVAKSLVSLTSAPITRKAHAEHIRLLGDQDRDPKFHRYSDLPVEMRLQILEFLVGSQCDEDTQKLRLTSRAISTDVRKIRLKTIPFLVTALANHIPRRNEVQTRINMRRGTTVVEGPHGESFTVVEKTNLDDEEHHCPLDFARFFPMELKEHHKVCVILMIEWPLASRARVADFRQISHLVFAFVSFLRNDKSTKCRFIQFHIDFVTMRVQDQIQDKPMLSTDMLGKILWSLQYLPVQILLGFTGLLPTGFDGSMFDGPRATFATRPDSIAQYTTLRIRYDLALETLIPESKTDTARKVELEAAMHAVRLVGPSSNIANESDTAACSALKHLEHVIDLNDLVSEGMRMDEESGRLEGRQITR